ncbi:MAG: sensor histidine kinase [Syntrophomonadaceae bacterium]|nr:sensor histidine kinase [Syntrophomonadaceae bacterium]
MPKQDLTDKAVFFFCCTVISLVQPLGAWQIVPILAGAVAVGFFTYFEALKSRFVIGAAFLLACVFYQPLCAFIPVMVYSAYENERKFLVSAALIPLVTAVDLAWPLWPAIVMLSSIAIILKHRTAGFSKLRGHYLSLLDTTREMGAEIKNKNKLIMEKQDDEIRLAKLNERNRIAKEIHDHVGHRLSSAFLQIGAMLTQSPGQPQLVALKETLNLAMDNIRNSVHNLYESSLDLESEIAQLADNLSCCRVELIIQMQTDPEIKVKFALISAVKESFTNIAKHSSATLACLTLTEHPAFYQLVISDNGPAACASFEKGLGLKSISERVEALRGHFLVRIQNGFEIFITIPKEAAHETADRR